MKSFPSIWLLSFCLTILLPIHSVAKDMLVKPKLKLIPLEYGDTSSQVNENSIFTLKEVLDRINMYVFASPHSSDSLLLESDETNQIIQLFVDGLKNLRNENYTLALENFKAAKKINDQPVLTQCIAQTRFFLEENSQGPATSNSHYYLAIVHYSKLNETLLDIDLSALFDTQSNITEVKSFILNQGQANSFTIDDTIRLTKYTWKKDEDLGELKEIKYFAALAGISIDAYNDRNIDLFVEKLKDKYNTQLFALLYNQANIALYSGINAEDTEKKKVNFELAQSCFEQAFSYIEKFPKDKASTHLWKARTNYDYGILLHKASDGKDPKALEYIKLAVELGHKDPNNILVAMEPGTSKE